MPLLLWAAYTSGSLIGLRDRSFSIVLHDDLMADPLATIQRVFTEAAHKPPAQDVEFEIAVRSYLHEPRVPSRFAYPPSFATVDQLFRFLVSSSLQRDDRSAYLKAVDVRAWLGELFDLVGNSPPSDAV